MNKEQTRREITQETPYEYDERTIKEARENPHLPIKTVVKIWKSQLDEIEDYTTEYRILKLEEIVAYIQQKYPDLVANNERVKLCINALCRDIGGHKDLDREIFYRQSLEPVSNIISEYENKTDAAAELNL